MVDPHMVPNQQRTMQIWTYADWALVSTTKPIYVINRYSEMTTFCESVTTW